MPLHAMSLLCLISLLSCKTPGNEPDLIIFNARIYTVDPETPWAEAIAIHDGRISTIGDNETIEALKGEQTQVFDAGGHFIMPGFIEGHGHFNGLGESLLNLNFLTSRSWAEIVEAVAQKATTAKPGEWIIGRGWHQEKWIETPEPNVHGYPYHDQLSAVAPANPVLLSHASGHALFANKAAMDAAGVSIETPDPHGGRILRGTGGIAIGVFEENAQAIIGDVYREYLTTLSAQEMEARWQEGVRLAQAECLRKGITSFQDAGSSMQDADRLAALATEGKLDVRLWMMLRHTSEYLENRLTSYPRINVGDGFFTCRAVKVSIDGALGSYGAWLLSPYEDNPGFTGQNTVSLDELRKLADLCASRGMQLCTHAIGDRANRETLDVYAQKFEQHRLDQNVRWRIEHAQHLHPDDIPRFAALGIVAAMQGIHCTSDAPFVEKRLGVKRATEGAYVWRSLLDHGAVIANGTDAPVEDLDPLASLYASVTRRRTDNGMIFYPEQAMSREEAIYSYTLGCAYGAFEEKTKGSLAPGKYADLVILDKNLMTCTDGEIIDAKVLLTMVNGKVRYKSQEF